jgi:hypothetical protein
MRAQDQKVANQRLNLHGTILEGAKKELKRRAHDLKIIIIIYTPPP